MTPLSKPIPRYGLYISGDMLGMAKFDYVRFNEVASQLREKGFTVFSPSDVLGTDDWTWADYMRLRLKGLLESRALYVLNGYEASEWANIEIELAQQLEMDIIYEPCASATQSTTS